MTPKRQYYIKLKTDLVTDLASSGGEDADKVRVVPGVGRLHRARVVGGDGGRAHAEHPLGTSHVSKKYEQSNKQHTLYFPFHECFVTMKEQI